MNFIDKAIAVLSPKAGLSRQKHRIAFEMLRKYDAAAKGRRTDGWFATGSSANAELVGTLGFLRNRSRELVRNNSYARRAVSVIARNVIGTGIRPKSELKGTAAIQLMEVWNGWANDKDKCDFDGLRTFYGLQRLIEHTICESGGVIVRRRYVNDPIYPLRLQVLEPDFIDLLREVAYNQDGSYILQGVQFDKTGKRMGYWMYDNHPGDIFGHTLNSKFVPIDEVLYAFNVDRPGQNHGTPAGTSVLLKLRDLDDYEDAQLVRQKVAACFSVFVEDSTEVIAGAPGTATSSFEDFGERIEPGTIQRLGPGKRVSFASPPSAGGYSEYVSTVLHSVAVGYNITYESLTGDLSQVNFSSIRAGWLEAQRFFNDCQTDVIIPMICNPVWRWFMDSQLIANGTKFSAVTWTPPRREMIDPAKETEATIAAIRGGLISWQEAVRELGYDAETLLAQISEDYKNFDKNKIILDSDARQPKVATPKPPAPPTAE